MHPKIKNRPSSAGSVTGTVRPLMLHEVTNRPDSDNAAARRRMVAAQHAAGAANHARHHVSRHTQG
jgi:hypothetical protein